MKYSKSEIEESLTKLREWIKPGDTVYTVLRHVSRSGMSRNISVVLIDGDAMLHPNHAVARVTGSPLVRGGMNDAIKMGGCGMDMGFALVYDLSARLWPNGYGCMGDKCNSNDHTNGDRSYEVGAHAKVPSGLCPTCKHHGDDCTGDTASHHHGDGGYGLTQRWL